MNSYFIAAGVLALIVGAAHSWLGERHIFSRMRINNLVPAQVHAPVTIGAVTISMLASAALVLVGTRGRHPGWVGLLGVAAFTAWGAYA